MRARYGCSLHGDRPGTESADSCTPATRDGSLLFSLSLSLSSLRSFAFYLYGTVALGRSRPASYIPAHSSLRWARSSPFHFHFPPAASSSIPLKFRSLSMLEHAPRMLIIEHAGPTRIMPPLHLCALYTDYFLSFARSFGGRADESAPLPRHSNRSFSTRPPNTCCTQRNA